MSKKTEVGIVITGSVDSGKSSTIGVLISNELDNGNFFYGLERKISHGLIQNGHFVYDFSYRDIERYSRFLGIKNTGLKKMNQRLI